MCAQTPCCCGLSTKRVLDPAQSTPAQCGSSGAAEVTKTSSTRNPRVTGRRIDQQALLQASFRPRPPKANAGSAAADEPSTRPAPGAALQHQHLALQSSSAAIFRCWTTSTPSSSPLLKSASEPPPRSMRSRPQTDPLLPAGVFSTTSPHRWKSPAGTGFRARVFIGLAELREHLTRLRIARSLHRSA